MIELMVLVLDGNSEHEAHARWKIGLFGFKKKNRFVTALKLIRCLKHIKYRRLLLICAPFSELPSKTITRLKLGFFRSSNFDSDNFWARCYLYKAIHHSHSVTHSLRQSGL